MIAHGKVTKPGRNITVCSGDVFALKDGEKLIATMLATIMSIVGRGGLSG